MIWHLADSNIENRNRSTTLNFTGDLNVIADGDHGDGDGDGDGDGNHSWSHSCENSYVQISVAWFQCRSWWKPLRPITGR